MEKKIYNILGLMSGSSLDGLDIAYCQITWTKEGKVEDWQLIKAKTMQYSDQWIARLKGLPDQKALIFAKTNVYFGHYTAELVQQFLKEQEIEASSIDFIASHGHTIFHQPDRRLTVQIGDGAAIAAHTGITTMTNFRSQDVALDGEGAPLAPIAERYLFGGYDFYLNIGGIANLTANFGERWLAGDICAANQLLNFLSIPLMQAYDQGGQNARKGKVNWDVLEEVSALKYYTKKFPKSLGNDWVRRQVIPLYKNIDLQTEDKLATATEHIALELKRAVRMLIQLAKKNNHPLDQTLRLLVSGGGAYNQYLLERMAAYLQDVDGHEVQIIVPDAEIIDFKEAMLMAILGVLRMEGKPNSWKTVTGARRDTVNGAVYLGHQ